MGRKKVTKKTTTKKATTKKAAKKKTTKKATKKVVEEVLDEVVVERTKEVAKVTKKRKSRAKKKKVVVEKTPEEDSEELTKETATTNKRKSRAKKKTVEKEASADEPKEEKSVETKNVAKKVIKEAKKTFERPTGIQPEINIGTAGHVDEGKSTLIRLLTGKFPDEHSEELKRGITIRLGYADCDIYKCSKCDDPEQWSVTPECENCGGTGELVRRISFVDAPGHEILMQVMLSGAAIMDGVMLVIAANNKVPQPQTREHLAALTALGIENIVIVQNKVELVSEEEARQNYFDIKNFLKGTIAEHAPIIPMSAMHGANMDILVSALQHFIPTPKRDKDAPLLMHVARSFDINRPGSKPNKIKGAVLGGSLIQGVIKEDQEIIILPGLKKRDKKGTIFIPVKTKVESIRVGESGKTAIASPGGLLAIQTQLDPSMARSDNLAGSLVSAVGQEPPVINGVTINVNLFDSVVGSDQNEKVAPIKLSEKILLTIGTSTTVGTVSKILKKGNVEFTIKPQVAIDAESKVALSRQLQKRWRLIGWASIEEFKAVPIKIQN